jgi:hypothetical protein
MILWFTSKHENMNSVAYVPLWTCNIPPEGERRIAQDKQSAVLGELSKRSISPVGAARMVSNAPAAAFLTGIFEGA